MSHTPRCKLVDYLEELNEEEFEKFKMHLEDYPMEKGYKPIRRSKTEKATQVEIARYMIEAFDDTKALKMTFSILDRINKKDLAARIRKEMLEYFLPKPSTMTKKEKKKREKAILSNLCDKFLEIPKKVEVILDPKTAYPALILSEDRKRVHMGEQTQVQINSSQSPKEQPAFPLQRETAGDNTSPLSYLLTDQECWLGRRSGSPTELKYIAAFKLIR